MIDKVQKIREEVVRMHNLLPVMDGDNIYVNYADRICTTLEMYIDSLKEEPAPKILEDMFNAKTPAESLGISAEEHDRIVDELIYGKEPEMVDVDDLPKEEPVSEDLEEVAKHYLYSNILYDDVYIGNPTDKDCIEMFKAGAKWQKQHLWKPADGDDLPEIDREVIVLVQDYPDDKEHLRVVFAHRPNKYAKVWNSDLGEEQVVEIERHGKGGWNIPDVKYWLDVELPKEIEL